jgi:5-methylcytosine-specific restriction endonuclease McrA
MAEPISEALRQLVTRRARGCCEYCRSQEAYATERFSVEHIQPRALGGLTVAENLALACQGCNGHKAAKTTAADPETNEMTVLFHPRQNI